MTWTYTMKFDGTVRRDEVRLLVQDTTETEPLVQDEEIDYFLSNSGGNVRMAALSVARVIHAKFTKRVDKEVGDLRNFWSQRAKNYMDVVSRLEREIALVCAPYAGGISEDDKDNQEDDTDRVPPKFTKDMQQNTTVPIIDITRRE